MTVIRIDYVVVIGRRGLGTSVCLAVTVISFEYVVGTVINC